MDAMSIQQPRVGCGAAILRGREILLIRRLTEPEAGAWGLPGGKVDWLEPVPQAVTREIEEELGIIIELGPLLGVLDQIDALNGSHWVAPIYKVERFAGEPRIMEPHKHGELRWYPLGDLPQPLTAAARFASECLDMSSR